MKKESKKMILLIVLVFVLLGLASFIYFHTSYFACKRESCNYNTVQIGKKEEKVTYIDISSEEAQERLKKEQNIIVLDVRTVEEYEEGHIPNSILLPLQNLPEGAGEKLPNKQQTIFVYCRSGVRSRQACQILIDLGYERIFNLGGILDWTGEIVK